MTINYAVYKNNMTDEPSAYRATIRSRDTCDMEQVIDRIIQQGSTVTRADIASVLEDYQIAVENLLLEGNRVNTPLANFQTSIRGTFAGKLDTFDANRHELRAAVSPGRRLRSAILKRARVSKQEATTPSPNPEQYVDLDSDEIDGLITPGGMGQLIGHRLKFDAAEPAQGIFFVDAYGDEARVQVVGRNMPGDLMFKVPADLAAGSYHLEVRAAFGDETVRSGSLEAQLTVQ